MVTRVFVGWNQPFVGLAADHLLGSLESLPGTLVLVPTAQAGRQLMQVMASRAGAILSPRVLTPGSMMRTEAATVADNWLEKLAWQEVLENHADVRQLGALFPEPPELEGDWAGGLADEMLELRHTLQENGLTLADAAVRLGTSVEADRWRTLARLERQVEQWLDKTGHQSRSRLLASGIPLPAGIERAVLAGISELPPIVERSLLASGIPLISLIGAPESLAAHFSDSGQPLPVWSELPLPWPEHSSGSVQVCADTNAQARLARDAVAAAHSAIADVALGTADNDAGDAMAREFSLGGWCAHHPAATTPCSGVRRWLATWRQWLIEPTLANLMDLLALPETSSLIEGDRARLARELAQLRDQWMVMRPDDLRHQIQHGNHRRLRPEAVNVVRAVESLERWRRLCLDRDTRQGIQHLLDGLKAHSETAAEQITECEGWLQQAAPLIRQLQRPATFWLDLMLGELPTEISAPPDDRVIDVQGWLELFFEPGSHLVLCGMNEGKVPAIAQGNPWLGASGKTLLGLRTDDDRAARDAYLLHAMIHARLESGGRVDLICARSSDNGEPMLPSRLLLAAEPQQLPSRIELLFREIEPPDAKLRWHADWKWQAPTRAPSKRLNATSFADYLACPFRFHLKHGLKFQDRDPERIEWNPRDFGNVVHHVLECWGNDTDARELGDATAIHQWLCRELEQTVDRSFGKHIPLAVRIQSEAIRQRLQWFAEIQAETHAEGWQVLEVEHKFEIPIQDSVIAAKIDRIDRHRESGQLRVIDYKTGKDEGTAAAHRSQWRANSSLPEHLGEQDPVLYTRIDKNKEQTYRWKNLQLPIYTLAIQQDRKQLATPCYFKLGETRADAALNPWEDYDEHDLEAAERCAHWVVGQIAHGRFWPPAAKVKYDDYELLSSGRPLDEMFDKHENLTGAVDVEQPSGD